LEGGKEPNFNDCLWVKKKIFIWKGGGNAFISGKGKCTKKSIITKREENFQWDTRGNQSWKERKNKNDLQKYQQYSGRADCSKQKRRP